MKIVTSRSADRSPWIITPVSAISSSPVSRSSTISAPWPSADSSAAARATSVDDVLGGPRVGRREEPAERPDAADPLERAAQLGLEDDDEGEHADDRAGLQDLGQEPQVERDGEAVDSDQDADADDQPDRARPADQLNSQ